MNSVVKIRPLEPNDFPEWLPLWDGNNLGHRNEEVTTETWARLTDPASQVNGLGAFDGGTMVGLVHYIIHPTTGYIEHVCYMQDVWVDPERRGQGIAKKLVQALVKIGNKEKWARMHWFAENNNEAAQALYKNLGVKLDFSLHVYPMK